MKKLIAKAIFGLYLTAAAEGLLWVLWKAGGWRLLAVAFGVFALLALYFWAIRQLDNN